MVTGVLTRRKQEVMEREVARLLVLKMEQRDLSQGMRAVWRRWAKFKEIDPHLPLEGPALLAHFRLATTIALGE